MEELKITKQEKLTGASELAAKLGITLQMLSVYVKAYTQVTKVQIQKVGRKGRHFDALQVQILTNARDIVRTNTGVSVEEAMRRALVFDSEALESASVDIQAHSADAALTAALRREVAGPIVEELQALRREIAELKSSRVAQAVEPNRVDSPGVSEPSYSPVVRLLRRWLGVR